MIRFRIPEGAMTNLALVFGRAGAALPPASWAHDIRKLLSTIGSLDAAIPEKHQK